MTWARQNVRGFFVTEEASDSESCDTADENAARAYIQFGTKEDTEGVLGDEVFGHETPWQDRAAWLKENGLWEDGTAQEDMERRYGRFHKVKFGTGVTCTERLEYYQQMLRWESGFAAG